jgi:hypothetical protein
MPEMPVMGEKLSLYQNEDDTSADCVLATSSSRAFRIRTTCPIASYI